MDDDTADDSLALGNQLCFSVYSTAHAFTRLYSTLLKSLDVTYTQYLVLLVLWEEDGPTVKSLGDRLSLDSGTLTPLLRRLEQAGYVRRERDGRDQRRMNVYLTDLGRRVRPDVQAVRRAVFEATGLSQGELKDLQRQLEYLRAGLEGGVRRHRDRTG
jgi:DNA-binding MarR family transcriptional regulator